MMAASRKTARDADLYFVTQYYNRDSLFEKNGVQEARIFFNGGEILVEWELIKEVVQRIEEKYKDINVDYSINTNLTLLTAEMAEFFNRYNFQLHISIDGYGEAHNRTRKYHNGRGSFDDIVKNVEIYRQYNTEKKMKNFQEPLNFPMNFNRKTCIKWKNTDLSVPGWHRTC